MRPKLTNHILSNLNIENRAANCLLCGSVKINKANVYKGQQHWKCQNYDKKYFAPDYQKTERHVLKCIDAHARTGICEICGETEILHKGDVWICRAKQPLRSEIITYGKRLHSLSSINEELHTATCSHCGPVALNKSGIKDGKQIWKCKNAHKIKSIENRPYRHQLFNIDPLSMEADCKRCGERVKIHTRGRHKGKQYYRCQKANRWASISQKYNLHEDQYNEMYKLQGGKCAICDQPQTKLCVDHCHKTKKVRALLCHHCNVILGHVKDDPQLLQKAIRYVRRHSSLDLA